MIIKERAVAPKKYVVQYDIGGALYYEVEADSPAEAAEIADNWFYQYPIDTFVRELTPADAGKDYDELDNWERVY